MMREAALKSVIFVGIPRVSLCEKEKGAGADNMNYNLDDPVFDGLKGRARRRRIRCVTKKRDQVRRDLGIAQQHEVLAFLARREASAENIEATVQRGMDLWKSIYEPHAVKLYDKLGALHPDFISTYSFPSLPRGLIYPPLPVDDNLSHRLVYMTCLEFDEY